MGNRGLALRTHPAGRDYGGRCSNRQGSVRSTEVKRGLQDLLAPRSDTLHEIGIVGLGMSVFLEDECTESREVKWELPTT